MPELFSTKEAEIEVKKVVKSTIKRLYDSIQDLTFEIDLRRFKHDKDKEVIRATIKRLRKSHTDLVIFRDKRLFK